MSYNMGYHLFTDLPAKTAPPISITATPTAASATIRTAPTYITPPSNYHPPLPFPKRSLFDIAKILTSHLFASTPLPPDLAHYTLILSAFITGAGLAIGLYSYIQRHKTSRAKIQLAIFHVVRWLRNLDDFKQRLANPKELIAAASKEVGEMVEVYGELSKSEGEETFKAVKRTIWGYVDELVREDEAKRERESKRRKVEEVEMRTIGKADEMDVETPSSPPGDVRDGGAPAMDQAAIAEDAAPSPTVNDDDDDDVEMTDYDSPTPALMRESFASPARESELSSTPHRMFERLTSIPMSTLDLSAYKYPSDSSSPEVFEETATPVPSAMQDRSTYEYPYSSSSTSPEGVEEAAVPVPSSAQGQNTYKYPSSPSLSPSSSAKDSSPPNFDRPSNPTPSRSRAQVYEHEDTPRPKTPYGLFYPELKEEEEKEQDEEDDSPATRQHGASTPTRTQTFSHQRNDTPRPNPPKRLSTYLHKTSILQPAPQSIELLPSVQTAQTNTSTKAIRPTIEFPIPYSGTLLCTLPEGISPQQSPSEGTTQYRAAGTKKTYREILQATNLRRGIRNFFGMKDTEKKEESEDSGEAEVKEEAGSSTPIAPPPALEIKKEDEVMVKEEEQEPNLSPSSPKPSPFLISQTPTKPSTTHPSSAKSSQTPTNTLPAKHTPTPPHRNSSRHSSAPPTNTPSRDPDVVQLQNSPEMPAPQPDVVTPPPAPTPARPGGKPRNVSRTPMKKRNPGETLVGVRKSARIASRQVSIGRSVGR
ncbi:hypothetical protein PTMSG1_07303 [Pyrenophora teres f. maculata]|nr:hypothetical protein PTMSG1_07303 [Pyrenophora teres f. maculata]